MAGGRRRFNVWIAYSDLFTNLSAFLFISAIGLFAMIGSGQVPGALPGASRCPLPESVTQALTDGDGVQLEATDTTPVWTEVPAAETLESDPSRCTRYFYIRDWQFIAPVAERGFLQDINSGLRPKDNKLKLDIIRERACIPIWRVLAQNSFREAKGRLTFIGLASAKVKREPQLRCSAVPRIASPSPKDFGKVDAVEMVWRCEQPKYAGDRACLEIRNCKDKGPRTSELCALIRAAEIRNEQNIAACTISSVTQHAKMLYDICESAPLTSGFPSKIFDKRLLPETSGAVWDDARFADGRQHLWEPVRFDGQIRGWETRAPPESDQPGPLVPRRESGTVLLIKVETDR